MPLRKDLTERDLRLQYVDQLPFLLHATPLLEELERAPTTWWAPLEAQLVQK